MDDRENTAGTPATGRRQGFGQRLPFIVAGMMIGMVLYFALFLALGALLGGGPAQLIARSISLAAAFYIAVVYPQRNPRAALGLMALGTAAALTETLLIR